MVGDLNNHALKGKLAREGQSNELFSSEIRHRRWVRHSGSPIISERDQRRLMQNGNLRRAKQTVELKQI